MDMKFFVTASADIQTCPTNLKDAQSSKTVLPIYSSDTVTVGGSAPGAKGSTLFRLTNGWLKQGFI